MILTAFCAAAYPHVIQYKAGGLKRWIWTLPALFVAFVDVVANYTELANVWGWPRPGEFTISKRVKRMTSDPDEKPARRELARFLQIYLDAGEPDGQH